MASYVVALTRGDNGIEADCQIYAGKITARTSLPLPAIVMINPGHFSEAKGSRLKPGNRRDPKASIVTQRICPI